jgi:hypothetical protein
MNHGINTIVLEYSSQRGLVSYVNTMKVDRPSGNLLYTFNDPWRAITEIINTNNFAASLEQANAGMGGDVSGCTGHENDRLSHRASAAPYIDYWLT